MLKHRTFQIGFSLVEILLILVFLSVAILPIGILISTNAGAENQVSTLFTRNSVLNEMKNAIDPDRATFYADYNMSSTQSVTDGNSTVKYIRKVYLDTTNLTTNDMARQVDYYVYNSAGNIISQTSDSFILKEIRIDVGNPGDSNGLGGFMDSTHSNWINDTQAYSSANQVPGTVGSASTTTGNNAATLANVSTTDNPIFQTYREATSGPIEYKFDLPNGDYIVQLYFAETNSAVTGTSPNRRNADILINGITVDSTYSARTSMGANLLGEVRSYPTTITNNFIDLVVQDAVAGTDLHPRLMGLVISKSTY